jgi:hypothetical protein
MYKGPWKVLATRRSQDPNAPKRPMSAFLSFSNSKRAEVKEKHPNIGNAEISRILAQMWKDASEEERKDHVDKEFKLRQEYKLAIAKWRTNSANEMQAARKEREDQAMKAVLEGKPVVNGFLAAAPVAGYNQDPPLRAGWPSNGMGADRGSSYHHQPGEEGSEPRRTPEHYYAHYPPAQPLGGHHQEQEDPYNMTTSACDNFSYLPLLPSPSTSSGMQPPPPYYPVAPYHQHHTPYPYYPPKGHHFAPPPTTGSADAHHFSAEQQHKSNASSSSAAENIQGEGGTPLAGSLEAVQELDHGNVDVPVGEGTYDDPLPASSYAAAGMGYSSHHHLHGGYSNRYYHQEQHYQQPAPPSYAHYPPPVSSASLHDPRSLNEHHYSPHWGGSNGATYDQVHYPPPPYYA